MTRVRRWLAPVFIALVALLYLHAAWVSPLARAQRSPIHTIVITESQFLTAKQVRMTNKTLTCVPQPTASLNIDCSIPINGQPLRITTRYSDEQRNWFKDCVAQYAGRTFDCATGFGTIGSAPLVMVNAESAGIDMTRIAQLDDRPFWERLAESTWLRMGQVLVLIGSVWCAWRISRRFRVTATWRYITTALLTLALFYPLGLIWFFITAPLGYYD